MNSGTVGRGVIRIDADTANAVAGLRSVSSQLNSLVPGGQSVAEVFNRIGYGFNQIIQGISRTAFLGITDAMRSFVDAGVDMAETLESAAVGFETLLGSASDAQKLVEDIQAKAVTTPFDVDDLTLSTQKLALITRNGANAEQTVLDLGKALTAAGRGNAELNRMATNLQQIGTNAFVTVRDIREFGNAGINITEIVAKYSEAFKQTGKNASEVTEWLQSISDPYEVITNALHNATNGTGEFADIYDNNMSKMKQVTENFGDAVGILSYRVLEESEAINTSKEIMTEFTKLFTDKTFAANVAAALGEVVEMFKKLNFVEPLIQGIRDVVSAFANGQFDNIIVFFKSLFQAISQFSGIQVVVNMFKVLFDLFSNNHTAEEVAKVATQIGNFIRVLLELKLATSVAAYVSNLATTIYGFVSTLIGVVDKAGTFVTFMSKLGTAAKVGMVGVIGLVGAMVALSALSSTSVVEFFENMWSAIKNFAEGLAEGLANVVEFFENIWSAIEDFAEGLANAVGDFFTMGWNLVAGLWNGLSQGLSEMFNKIGEIANSIVNTFKAALGIHSPSTRMRDEVGQYIDLGIAAGIKRYYGTIAQASEEVLEKLVDLQANYVDELSDFGALDIVQEINVYKQFAALYEKGTKARIEMDDKVHSAEIKATKQIIELVDTYNDKYQEAYKTAKQYYDMFEYTQNTLTRTTKSVITGLTRQNENMSKYYENLYKISQMGFDDDFLTYLYDQGMEASSEVAGLADATKEQIDEINKLWATRGETSAKIATLNTKELKDSTLEQIDYLQSGLETRVVDVYDTGTLLGYNFTRGIYDMIPTIEEAAMRVAASATSSTKSATEALSDSGESAFSDAVLGDIEDLTADLHDMNIEAFDTVDVFSLIKNLLSGIPWYTWALGAGALALSIASNVKQAKQQQAAMQGMAKVGDIFESMTQSSKNYYSKTAALEGTYQNGSVKASRKFYANNTSMHSSYLSKTSKTYQDYYTQRAAVQEAWQNSTMSSIQHSHKQTIAKLNNVADTIKNVFHNIRDIISTAIQDAVGTILDSIKGVLKEVLNFIKTFVSNVLKTISDLFKEILKTVKTMLRSLATTLEQMVPSVKSILNSIEQVVKTVINKITNIVAQLVRSATKILKLLMKGIGEGIKALIEPLSDPKLIIGAGVLVLVATALIEVALAAQMFANTSLDAIVNMGVFAAALYALSFAMAGLGQVAGSALAGAVAMAATGAALTVAALALGLASDAVDKINYANLVMLAVDLAVAAIAMGVIGKFAQYVGIGAIVTAAISAGLAVAAACLALASQAVDSINYGNLALLSLSIGLAGVILAVIGHFAAYAAIGSIVSLVISGGLLVSALALSAASSATESVNIGSLLNLEIAIGIAAIILGVVAHFAAYAAIGSVVAMVISGGLLVAALALNATCQIAPNIDIGALLNLEGAIAIAAVILGLISPMAVLASIGAVASMVISGGLLVAALALEETCKHTDGIDIGKLLNLEGAIAIASIILGLVSGFAVLAVVASIASMVIAGGLLVTAIALTEACNHTDGIDIGKLLNLEGAIAIAAVILAAVAGFAILGTISAVATMAISGGLLVSALALEETCKHTDDIDIDKLGKLEGAIAMTDVILAACAAPAAIAAPAAANSLAISNAVKEIIDNIYQIIDKLNGIDGLLQEGETAKGKMEQAIALIIQIAQFRDSEGNTLSTESEGLFRDAYDGLKKSTENLIGVAEHINGILDGIKGIIDKLNAIDDILQSGSSMQREVADAVDIVIQIAQFQNEHGESISTSNGLFSSAYKGLKEATGNISAVTDHIASIMESIKNLVTTLKTLRQDLPTTETVQGYVSDAIDIVVTVAEFKDGEGHTLQLREKYDKLKTQTENLKNVADYVNQIISSVKNMVDTLKGLHDAGVTQDQVRQYVVDACAIVEAVASIEITKEDLDKTATAVENIGKIATNVNTVLTQTKSIVDNMAFFTENESENLKKITDTGADGYITKINEMLKALGTLSAENETENAYKNLADNTGSLGTAAQNVATILDNAKNMFDKVEEFAKAMEGKEDLDVMVQKINRWIAIVAGGTAYTYEEGNKWHQGIVMPTDTTFNSDTATNLGYVSTALDKVKEIAQKINEVPDAAESISNVEAIVKFISDTMGKVPEAINTYTEDLVKSGQAYANAFKQGWESVYPDITNAGHQLQGTLWTAIQEKMEDEYRQGQALAQSVNAGIWDKSVEAKSAGEAIQTQLWWGIQLKMEDERQQGAALGMAVVDGVYSTQDWWWHAGDDVATGFAGGIFRNMWRVNDAVGYLSSQAINKLKDLLDIHSPSKVMAELGGYVAEGFAEGIEDGLSDVEDAGEKLAEAVMGGYESSIKPIDLTAFEARNLANGSGASFGGTSNKNTTINQYNNIYDNMDMSRALSELTWSVSRA